jgi:broad specificity phosphatase PhoE
LRDPAATPHGRESILSLMRRVADWLAGENGEYHLSIVVTHATIIRAAIVHAIEATPQSFWRIDIALLSLRRLSGTINNATATRDERRSLLLTANQPFGQWGKIFAD